MTLEVKVSKKYQIALPSALRKQLWILNGDHPRAEVRDGNLVFTPEKRSCTDQIMGLHKEVWEGIDVDEYIRQERASRDRS
jgi:bifunctional DNA-binding transcriptional regulator/antitoxin component of YhaV-PrlF toxin-antitoxin module